MFGACSPTVFWLFVLLHQPFLLIFLASPFLLFLILPLCFAVPIISVHLSPSFLSHRPLIYPSMSPCLSAFIYLSISLSLLCSFFTCLGWNVLGHFVSFSLSPVPLSCLITLCQNVMCLRCCQKPRWPNLTCLSFSVLNLSFSLCPYISSVPLYLVLPHLYNVLFACFVHLPIMPLSLFYLTIMSVFTPLCLNILYLSFLLTPYSLTLSLRFPVLNCLDSSILHSLSLSVLTPIHPPVAVRSAQCSWDPSCRARCGRGHLHRTPAGARPAPCGRAEPPSAVPSFSARLRCWCSDAVLYRGTQCPLVVRKWKTQQRAEEEWRERENNCR